MTSRTSSLLAAGAAALLLSATAALPAAAAPAAAGDLLAAAAPERATVSVTGEGSAETAPDLALVNAGVEVTRPTAEQALAAQSAAADALLAAVRARGVADADVRTEGLSLDAVHASAKNGTLRTVGYRSAQSFVVKVREIGRAGELVTAVTEAAGDAGRVHGVTFDVADPTALRAEARRAAHLDARAKAEQHAELSGHRLGRLVSLTEEAGGRPRPVTLPAAAFDAPAKLATGRVQDQVNVTAVYELR
ncbi:SIMPL domain-containing protein [Streptomyces sp. NPDC060194]|uniref:SIMPL domain-containing protein n=1 Tax=Streptomyces sp. NPDC060194 TaxID=3347069 RepID=UPI00364E00D7